MMSNGDPPISDFMNKVRRDRDAEDELAKYFLNQCIAAATRKMSDQLRGFVDPEVIASEALRSAISDLTNCRVSPANRDEFAAFLRTKTKRRIIDTARRMTATRRDPSKISPTDPAELTDSSTPSPDMEVAMKELAVKAAAKIVGEYIGKPIRPSRLMTATLGAFTFLSPQEILDRVNGATGESVTLSTVQHTVREVRQKFWQMFEELANDAE